MKRFWICCLALTMILSLAACGGGDQPSSTPDSAPTENVQTPAAVDVKTLMEDIMRQVPLTDPLEPGASYLLDTYGIQDADVKAWAARTTLMGTGGFPDEAVLVEAVDAAAAGRIKTALENHVENMKNQAKDYSPEGYALAESVKVMEEGNYLALFLCADYESMEAIFENAF